METLLLGSVVYSKSGRDSGNYYAVMSVINDEYVTIADGEIRKIEKAKKKKIKHLKYKGEVLTKIAAKLKDGETVHNSELRSALRSYNENI